ncbi:MAG: AbrB/MazE/SpoVT family DNA-binding domain-containing protein [Chloroflexota bacterium]|nr:AbrB/MazE/SpoVT family DNA-binding domain-containing protein [Chloroflexota bacterium]
MRISERGQITIPKRLRDRYGMNHNVEVDITPTTEGLLIRKQAASEHPVDKVSGILNGVEQPGIPSDVDEYIEEIRGA